MAGNEPSSWMDEHGEWRHGYRCADCDYCVKMYREDFEDILIVDAGYCRLGQCLVPTPNEPTEIARECLEG